MRVAAFALPMAFAFATVAAAQDGDDKPLEAQRATPPERIDLLVAVPEAVDDEIEDDELSVERCDRLSDEARISGEIVVCRQRRGEDSDGTWDQEGWEERYARKTQGEQPVDVAGGGIFRGPATVGGLCLLNKCPPPPAIFIDIEALPEPPVDSDADRIRRGLPPKEVSP